MLIGNLSNVADKGGVTGMAVYNNKGDFVAKYDMPTSAIRTSRAMATVTTLR